MIVVADSNIILDFLDGLIDDPYAIIHPYRMIFLSPVVLHEVLRAYPEGSHSQLTKHLIHELLPPPSVGHWVESAKVLRRLYPLRKDKNVARMQNDVLIALAARDVRAPVWSRDTDFELVCDSLSVGLFNK